MLQRCCKLYLYFVLCCSSFFGAVMIKQIIAGSSKPTSSVDLARCLAKKSQTNAVYHSSFLPKKKKYKGKETLNCFHSMKLDSHLVYRYIHISFWIIFWCIWFNIAKYLIYFESGMHMLSSNIKIGKYRIDTQQQHSLGSLLFSIA